MIYHVTVKIYTHTHVILFFYIITRELVCLLNYYYKQLSVRSAAADIAAHRGAAQETDKSADRSRKNNPGAEDGRIEKVLIDPIVVGGCDKSLDNVISPFFLQICVPPQRRGARSDGGFLAEREDEAGGVRDEN